MTSERNVKLKKKYDFYRTMCIILCTLLLCSAVLCAFFAANRNTPVGNGTSETTSVTPTETVPVTEETEDKRIEALESSLASYEEQLEALESLSQEYGEIASTNFGMQAEKLSELLEILTSESRPQRVQVETDADGEETGEKTYSPSVVSFCYTDLTTGYTFSYNGDKIMYTASLIKAPYIYAVLKSVEDFEYKKMNFAEDGSPLYAEDGSPLFEGSHPNLNEDGSIKYLAGEEKFDLSRVWTYNSKTMYEKGSGEIQKKKDGFQLTYLELAEYALKYSDNIAFAQFKKAFGVDEYNALTKELEISGASKGFMQLSAKDCAKFLTKIHEFCESGGKYGTSMKNALSKTAHEVLIPAAVSPTPCIHKYGWDKGAYHDMGIIYDTHPFSLVIMTDLDTYSGENNAFIHKITKLVLEMHRGFRTAE